MYFKFIWIWWNQRSTGISTRLKYCSLFFFLTALLFSVSFFIAFALFPGTQLGLGNNTQVELTIAEGSRVKTILKQLSTQKVITPFQSCLFEMWIRLQGTAKKIQAGEYRFSSNITPKALMQKWIKGEVILYSVTIPEGVTLQTFVNILAYHPKTKKVPINMDFMANEGLYYPDTYYFSLNMPPEQILKKARSAMQQKLEKAWQARDQNIALATPYEALVLASIIEKETASDVEKPIISGVFQRRLMKKMRLQADPTVIYGLQGSFNGNITKADLKTPTPYNTYTRLGLPPTPIALPGMRSIEAALHPDNSDYLYFVGKGDGTHHFSATLQEHNEAVKKYQKEK